MEFECTLENKAFSCEYRENETGCKGNDNCCFCKKVVVEEPTAQKGYVRKERWYEKYYEKNGSSKKNEEFFNPWH